MCELCSCTPQQQKDIIYDGVGIGNSVQNLPTEVASNICHDLCCLLYNEKSPLSLMCHLIAMYGYDGVQYSTLDDAALEELWLRARTFMTRLTLEQVFSQLFKQQQDEGD